MKLDQGRIRSGRVLSNPRGMGAPGGSPSLGMSVAEAGRRAPVRPFKTMSRKQGGFPVFSLLALAFLVGCGWLALSADSLREYMAAHRDRDIQLQQVAALRAEIQQLRARYESARRNGLETQRQIRERLDMRRPGERVLFLQRPAPEPVRADAGDGKAGVAGGADAVDGNSGRRSSGRDTPMVVEEPEGLPGPKTGRLRPSVPAAQPALVIDEPDGLPGPG